MSESNSTQITELLDKYNTHSDIAGKLKQTEGSFKDFHIQRADEIGKQIDLILHEMCNSVEKANPELFKDYEDTDSGSSPSENGEKDT